MNDIDKLFGGDVIAQDPFYDTEETSYSMLSGKADIILRAEECLSDETAVVFYEDYQFEEVAESFAHNKNLSDDKRAYFWGQFLDFEEMQSIKYESLNW